MGQGDDPDGRELQRRSVAGWTVVATVPSDGGRLIELGWRTTAIEVHYHANFWRGNAGELRGVTVRVGECTSGAGEAVVARPETAEALRARLRSHLAECRVQARQQARILSGLGRAYCLFGRWAAEAAADTAYENAEIAAYGTDETPRRPRPDYPDCRL